jgi:hypothetical protein
VCNTEVECLKVVVLQGYLMQEGVLVKVGRILVFLAGVLTLIALWVHQVRPRD